MILHTCLTDTNVAEVVRDFMNLKIWFYVDVVARGIVSIYIMFSTTKQ